jgi:hypothetical protein
MYRLALGMRNYLIEGVSSTGKTSVCKELQRRGYDAIHGDSELAYLGDPETGTPTLDAVCQSIGLQASRFEVSYYFR